MVNGDQHDIWAAISGIKADVSAIRTDVAVLRTEYNGRQPRCNDHEERIKAIAAWMSARDVAGRPPSRATVLLTVLLGQLLVGAGIVVAVVRAMG